MRDLRSEVSLCENSSCGIKHRGVLDLQLPAGSHWGDWGDRDVGGIARSGGVRRTLYLGQGLRHALRLGLEGLGLESMRLRLVGGGWVEGGGEQDGEQDGGGSRWYRG